MTVSTNYQGSDEIKYEFINIANGLATRAFRKQFRIDYCLKPNTPTFENGTIIIEFDEKNIKHEDFDLTPIYK